MQIIEIGHRTMEWVGFVHFDDEASSDGLLTHNHHRTLLLNMIYDIRPRIPRQVKVLVGSSAIELASLSVEARLRLGCCNEQAVIYLPGSDGAEIVV